MKFELPSELMLDFSMTIYLNELWVICKGATPSDYPAGSKMSVKDDEDRSSGGWQKS